MIAENSEQGSASGTRSPGSRSPGPGNQGPGLGPGLILKSGTQIQNLRDLGPGPGLKFEKSGTGTQNQKIRDSGSGPRLKIEKSGIRDWDRDSDLRDEGFRDSTLRD